jgi:hypothetical protein
LVEGEKYLATVARLLAAEGDALGIELISKAVARFEWSSHDNWDGGLDIYHLYLDLPLPLYSKAGDRRESIEKSILDKLQAIMQAHTNDHVTNVLMAVQLEDAPDWRERARASLNTDKGEDPDVLADSVHPPITCRPEVFRRPEKGIDEEQIAVMMPFAVEFRPTYEAIKRACVSLGLRAVRADDIWEASTFMQDIFSIIYCSRIIIVDYSHKNPNVMYETGIAHTLGRQVVPITQSAEHVPSDLRHHRALFYLPNAEGLEDLEHALTLRLGTITGREPMADQAASSIEQTFIAVDDVAAGSPPFYYKYDSSLKGWEFLEMVSSNVPHLRPERYGKDWLLRDRKSGVALSRLRTCWRERAGLEEESTDLKGLGVIPGMHLEVVVVEANA